MNNTNYSGAIDYYVFKDDINRYIIILLDNHNPSSYCEFPSENIDSLFELFINKKSIFILEEPFGVESSKIISIYPKTSHLTKYLKFYSKYQSNIKQIIPVDIRMLFDNFHKNDYNHKYELLDQLFGLSDCVNQDILYIRETIINASLVNTVFREHLNKLFDAYKNIKNFVNTDKECKINDYSESLFLNFPFSDHIKSYCEKIEQFLSGLLELYCIACIVITSNKYIFVYLGAAHCITIANLLEKKYGYRKIKTLDKYNILSSESRINLGIFDSNKISCINFNLT
jgi:hypothetical protein